MPFVIPAAADPALPDRFCLFDDGAVLLIDGALPGAEAAGWPVAGRRFLGVHAGANLYLGELVGAAPAGVWLPLRAALTQLPADDVPALARAAQIRRFQKTHRLCGACGTPLAQHAHDQGRGCPSCGEVYYPRVSPAMMLTVTRGDEILLARSPHFQPGVYSAIAGFVEPGETLEDCVRRECFEEVGVYIGAPVYLGSQSWPFPHSLMLAFTAEYAGGELTPQEGEIEDARWFARDALPATPNKPSIAHWLIERTLARMAAR
ncbi:NAD+ diphosphatase [Crenobacter luteus]|uniref:NAD(+) diphosphatase n=1 Tax=Crenobacter luteus TaxID=1452487 RepID=UPI0010509B60|nr:NAD(+) diphosphatase [Crenobacter luteus]TCP12132.1 NAD+ diphosphatase [Crenobacter luteus]